jgi:flagellar biosynthetic protein FliR
MLTFTEAQLLAWISPILWPFFRVLGLLTTMPVLSQRLVPMRVRIGLAFLVVLCAQASLPETPPIPLDNATSLLVLMQQLLIGASMGFAVRIVFSAVELAGEIVGLQMGLNFAGFFDPATGSQTTALSRFHGTIISWLFIIINGHLLLVAAVVQSFHAFPVGPDPMALLRTLQAQTWGAEIFRIGFWLALPLIGMLVFTNLVLGVIARVAQQLSIFSIGFPITLTVGILGTFLTLPMMEAPFVAALEKMLEPFQ